MPPREHDLERIFAQYVDSVYRFLYSKVGNREDAEDLTSQVFLKASQQLDSGRSEASVASWLFAVARTTLTDHWRRYYRAGASLELDEAVMASASHDVPAAHPSARSEQTVTAILDTLPSRYRRVLELRFLQGYSINEAAREMAVTVGNLKVLQHRALARAAQTGLPHLEAHASQAPSSADGDSTVPWHEQKHSSLAGRESAHDESAYERTMT